MGRAIDLFVTYRFIKLLVTPFEKTPAYKLGIIDKDGNRIMPPPIAGVRQTKPKSTIGGEPEYSDTKISLSKYIIWSYPFFGKCDQF